MKHQPNYQKTNGTNDDQYIFRFQTNFVHLLSVRLDLGECENLFLGCCVIYEHGRKIKKNIFPKLFTFLYQSTSSVCLNGLNGTGEITKMSILTQLKIFNFVSNSDESRYFKIERLLKESLMFAEI